MSSWHVLNAECVATMREMSENSVDSIVCDPPYDLIGQKTSRNGSISTGNMQTPAGRSGPSKARGFMGMHWDGTGVAFAVATWQAALRVAKPGAHLIAFGGTRTYHRMVVAIEDAGWEIRDCIVWHYATGFPKSRDIGKDIDKMAGAEREVVEYDASRARPNRIGKVMGDTSYDRSDNGATITAPATDDAKQWDGWGTALKPATELIVLARKPMHTTVARNVLAYGTGALNIGENGIGMGDDRSSGGNQGSMPQPMSWGERTGRERPTGSRWPANVAFDEAMAAELDRQSGVTTSAGGVNGGTLGDHVYGEFSNKTIGTNAGGLGDTGGASRFFFVAKPSTAEREAGCAHLQKKIVAIDSSFQDERPHTREGYEYEPTARGNSHPTTKPLTLMRHLVRLVTPPGGTVLDPFCGSGTTGCACVLEDFAFIGIEQDTEHGYIDIARARIAHYAAKPKQRSLL